MDNVFYECKFVAWDPKQIVRTFFLRVLRRTMCLSDGPNSPIEGGVVAAQLKPASSKDAIGRDQDAPGGRYRRAGH